MPVPSDTHDDDIDLTPGTAKSDIVALLYNNPDSRFHTDNIQDRLDTPHGTIATILTRLNNDGLIEKIEDEYYQAFDHRDDLYRYVGSLNQLEIMFNDKNYNEQTNRDGSQLEDVDEDELDAEIAELEADLDQA